ncbi:hypothetical protein BKA58DRAFT_199303 [Alternaria rosae]|uniref:uncharacterized protein n=1 Tax=Alternaria rosae TaxID=1187941 RepID=UPI001E8CB101|nr:uncharacterized protein BKA58DRAFT_199303 [Alternaria rosae]KAH6868700.1 hypothetical protein BKA58DRAFT_199303 [Alternaria rosae]
MAADDSNKAQTKCVTPDINKEYYHTDGNAGSDLQVKDNGQAGDDDEGDGEQSDDVDMDSHNADSYEAYIKKSKELKSQLRMHFSNNNMAQFDRIQQEFREHDLLGELEAELLDLDTAAALIALSRSSTDYRCVPPRPTVRILLQPSAQSFYAHLFRSSNAGGGPSTFGPASTAVTDQTAPSTQHPATASLVAVQAPAPVFSVPVLAAPQASPPTTLNFLPLPPVDISDNVSLGGGTGALNGPNKTLYLKAPPPSLDYNLLSFEITVMEMATYIPLAYRWYGFTSRARANGALMVIARMMLWARGLENGPDLTKNVDRLRSTLTKMSKEDYGSIVANKSASSWVPAPSIFTGGAQNLMADVPLLRLRHELAVGRAPQGQHCGRLTIAIEHAHTNKHWGVMLSQVHAYIQQCNLPVPAPLAASADVDTINDFKVTWRAAHPLPPSHRSRRV